MSKDKAHPIELDLFEALPAELDVGAPFSLAMALTTKSGCDLTGAAYHVLQGEEVVAAGVLPPITRFDPDSNDYDPLNGPVDKRDNVRIALCAPREIGVFQWTLVSAGAGARRHCSRGGDPELLVQHGRTQDESCSVGCSIAGCRWRKIFREGRGQMHGVLRLERASRSNCATRRVTSWASDISAKQCGQGRRDFTGRSWRRLRLMTKVSTIVRLPSRRAITPCLIGRFGSAQLRDGGAWPSPGLRRDRGTGDRERRSPEAQVRLGYYRAASDRIGRCAFHGAIRQTQTVRLEGGFLGARAGGRRGAATSISSSKPRLCRKRIPMRAGRVDACR